MNPITGLWDPIRVTIGQSKISRDFRIAPASGPRPRHRRCSDKVSIAAIRPLMLAGHEHRWSVQNNAGCWRGHYFKADNLVGGHRVSPYSQAGAMSCQLRHRDWRITSEDAI